MRLDQLPSIADLDPATVRQFLRSRGWVYQRETLPGVQEYALERSERRWLIDVPTPDYGDFARRMAELVELLAQVHSVPVLTLIDDLASPPGDVLEPSVIPYSRDAARSPEAGHCLEGYVVRLAREPEAEVGQIVVLEGTKDEGVRKVQVNLGRESYGLALEAHRTGGRVRMYGTLRRERKTLELEGATGLMLIAVT